MKIIITMLIALIGLSYHFEVAPQLHQGDQRRELANKWNSVNEAEGDESGVFYSTTDLLDRTLVIHTAPQAGTISEDIFLDDVESGDEQSGELRSLGFSQIQCGTRIVKLHEGSEHPSLGTRELDIEPVG
jgi:hypothetical protein